MQMYVSFSSPEMLSSWVANFLGDRHTRTFGDTVSFCFPGGRDRGAWVLPERGGLSLESRAAWWSYPVPTAMRERPLVAVSCKGRRLQVGRGAEGCELTQ